MNLKTRNKVILIIIMLVGSNMINSIKSINTVKSSIVKDGDYLAYDITINSFVTNNLSMVDVGAKSEFDIIRPIDTELRVEFHREDPQSIEIEVTLSFSMHGTGYLYYTREVNGEISFNYDFSVVYRGDNSNNKFYYKNGSEWGYLPFILPTPSNSSEIITSGSTQYPNELVKCEKDGDSFVNLPKQTQDSFILSVKNEPTAFGFDESLKLFPTYYYDSSTYVLLKSNIADPFWAIFNREFVLFGGSMILSSTNIDLGPQSLASLFYGGLSGLLVFLLPIIIIGSAGSVFFILRRKKKRRQLERKKRKFRY